MLLWPYFVMWKTYITTISIHRLITNIGQCCNDQVTDSESSRVTIFQRLNFRILHDSFGLFLLLKDLFSVTLAIYGFRFVNFELRLMQSIWQFYPTACFFKN